MAFHHEDGLPAAYLQAAKFAGQNGRLATMADIVSARLETKPGDFPWERYFTTLTAEYLGLSKSGTRILIVAHGVGPMSTLDGIRKAYSWQYKDQTRSRRGGRITPKEFLRLEAGEYGDVTVIDFDNYCSGHTYPFSRVLRVSEALEDALLKARLGSDAERYIQAHARSSKEWHLEQLGITPENQLNLSEDLESKYPDSQHLRDGLPDADPYVIKIGDALNCSYMYTPVDEGGPLAHLVSTGGLTHLHHHGQQSLVLDVDCHEWSDGVRLVGIKSGNCTQIHSGPDATKLLHDHWRELLIPINTPVKVGFRGLVEIDNHWFTQYPKQGARMDTGEPEYAVVSKEPLGEPVRFRTTIGGGYYGFFRFAINELKSIAPPRANAYFFVTDPDFEPAEKGSPTHHFAMVQFFHVTLDTSRRLMREGQLCHDYETMMQIMASAS